MGTAQMGKPQDSGLRRGVTLTPELAERVDNYRFGNRIKSDVETLRRLIEAGLSAEAARGNDAAAHRQT
jgi:hypothetical protein